MLNNENTFYPLRRKYSNLTRAFDVIVNISVAVHMFNINNERFFFSYSTSSHAVVVSYTF